jgi:hypothetical protein
MEYLKKSPRLSHAPEEIPEEKAAMFLERLRHYRKLYQPVENQAKRVLTVLFLKGFFKLIPKSARSEKGTVAKLAMRQPFVLFKGLTFQKLCLPGAFRPGDHHNKMLRPGLCVVHASPQYL